jgi:membrane protein required for colicin V production
MNWLDIIIFCILGLLVINGIRKGFILSLATLIALILGIWAAIRFSGCMSSFLIRTFHPTGTWLTILSYSLTFLLVVIGVIIIAKLLEKVVKTVGLGLANRLIGGLFGLLKGILGVSFILFLLVIFDPKENLVSKKTMETSFCYPYLAKVFPLYKTLSPKIM